MAIKQLTDPTIQNAPKPRALKMIWDSAERGLLIKLTPSGRKIWCLQRVYPGSPNQRIRTLGDYSEQLQVADARERARKWKDWLTQGIDPAAGEAQEELEREELRRAEALENAKQTENSFAKIARDYIADKRTWKTRNRRIEDDAREIERDLIAEWGDRPIASITPRDIRELIAKLRKGGSPGGVNGKPRKGSDRVASAAWGHLEQIFKFAVHDEKLEVSPCASVSKRMLFKGADLDARDRVLNDTEIAAYWRSADRMGYPIGSFYKLLLLTALRKSELAEAKRTELHPELRKALRDAAENDEPIDWTRVPDKCKLLTISSERFKSDAVHLVPLSNEACAIIESLPRFKGADWLFTESGEGAINGFSKSKARLDARMLRSLRAIARKRGDDPESVELKPWVQHDTRRTVRSKLGDLKLEGGRKVANHVSELILGHARKGLDGTYDRNSYIDDRREALQAWADYVREITQPKPAAPTSTRKDSNVIRLKAAR